MRQGIRPKIRKNKDITNIKKRLARRLKSDGEIKLGVIDDQLKDFVRYLNPSFEDTGTDIEEIEASVNEYIRNYARGKLNKLNSSSVHKEFVQRKCLKENFLIWISKCKHCTLFQVHHKNIKCTSELKRHLRVKHPEVYVKVEVCDQEALQQQKEKALHLEALQQEREKISHLKEQKELLLLVRSLAST